MKNYLEQIKLEITKILKSKVMLIVIALMLLISFFGVYIFEGLSELERKSYQRYQESFFIDDIEITSDSRLYWEIKESYEFLEQALEDELMEYDSKNYRFYSELLETMVSLTQYKDYHSEVSYQLWYPYKRAKTLIYIIEEDLTIDELDFFIEGKDYYSPMMTLGLEETEGILELSDIEKEKLIVENKAIITEFHTLMESNDYLLFYEYQLKEQKAQLEMNNLQISKYKDQLGSINTNKNDIEQQIKYLEERNAIILEVEIPNIEYKIENNVDPVNDWRNRALSYLNSAKYDEIYKVALTEEEFNDDYWRKDQYGTYVKYLEAHQLDIEQGRIKSIKAERSLENNKPDMNYVQDGSRGKVVGFFYFYFVIAIFGVMLGGTLAAKEFQNGTIRLLLIRPKTRNKIFISKLIALLIILFGIHVTSSLLNMISVGLKFGFSDYLYPNYTISGTVPFFAIYLSGLLVTFLPILFGTVLAFMFSSIIRKAAPSIAIPFSLAAVNGIFFMNVLWQSKHLWLKYTPVPYLFLFPDHYQGQRAAAYFDFGYGVFIIIACTIVFAIIGVWNLNARDINN